MFGTTNGIKSYSIVLTCEDGITVEESYEFDLSNLALIRLLKKIRDGTTPPVKRKSK